MGTNHDRRDRERQAQEDQDRRAQEQNGQLEPHPSDPVARFRSREIAEARELSQQMAARRRDREMKQMSYRERQVAVQEAFRIFVTRLRRSGLSLIEAEDAAVHHLVRSLCGKGMSLARAKNEAAGLLEIPALDPTVTRKTLADYHLSGEEPPPGTAQKGY